MRKRSSLWTAPQLKPQEFPLHLLFEVAAFAFYGLPLAIALLSWEVGHTPSAEVHWLGCAVYAGAMLSLSVLWVGVRKLNQDAARKLEEDSRREQDSEIS